MGNTLNNKKANGLALLPFLVFIVVYMGAGLVYQSKGVDMAFYQFPSVTAMFLAVLVAFIMFKGSINEKFDTFAKGAANVDVLTMLIIYILAGAFATVAAEMGGRDATVNLGLSLVPVQFLAAGLFVIAAFMGTATGTSMGTISAITPIAVGVAEKGGLNMMVVLGAVIGGAMFGDNLSMISDTTIAATRSQHCEMRDKFRVNFLTALPAALVTIVVLLIMSMGKFLNSSTEKMLMLQTDLNLATSETIGTYTYKIGLVKRQYGYSAAVDLFTNVINFSTLLIVNFVSKHVSNSSLF